MFARFKNTASVLLILVLSVYFLDINGLAALMIGGGGSSLPPGHFPSLILPETGIFLILTVLYRNVPLKIFKTVLILLFAGVSLPNVIILGHIFIFGRPLDYWSIITASDTNPAETADFIRTFLSPKLVPMFVIMAAPFILIYFIKPAGSGSKKTDAALTLAAAVICALTLPRGYVQREIALINAYDMYKQAKFDKEEFIAHLKKNSMAGPRFSGIDSSGLKPGGSVFVIVLGESVYRGRMSCYGYERKTTPEFDNMTDELFIFTDVISPHCHTSPSMEKILTFADMEDMSLRFSQGSVIDFFKAAGFKTFWISNQYMYGGYDSAYSAIASTADKVRFLNRSDWRGNRNPVKDGELLEIFSQELKDPAENKIFFIHLMGSHSPYKLRYPNDFQRFGETSLFNGILNMLGGYNDRAAYDAYDNSILYTDHVLKSIIDILKKLKTPSYMLYFADHGEDAGSSSPEEFYGHNESISTKPMFEIPFILWLSREYKNAYKNTAEKLPYYVDRPYQTDDVIHTILDLSRLEHPIKNNGKSIINDSFAAERRTCGGRDYAK